MTAEEIFLAKTPLALLLKKEVITMTNTMTVKNKIKGTLAASMWGLLFIGGMFFGSLAVMLLGIFFNIDFIVNGMYALMNFMDSLGTADFGTAVATLADEAAVFIHTTMCIGYLPVIIAMFIRRKEAGGFGTLKVSETANVFKWVAIAMSASFVLDLLMQLACKIPYFAQDADMLSSVGVLSTAGLPWLALLTTGILAPIVEEIAFRRGIQKAVTDKFGSVAGIAVASIAFGVMHGNLFQGIFAALMGIILGIVYDKTGNLWYTTIIHIVNNSAAVLIAICGLPSVLTAIYIPAIAALLYLATKDNCEERAVVEAFEEALTSESVEELAVVA